MPSTPPPSAVFKEGGGGWLKYKSLDRLKTAVNDAKEVDKILKKDFGFQTKLALNAGRDGIMKELNELRKRVKENDSVLIYYAGHGEYDKGVASTSFTE